MSNDEATILIVDDNENNRYVLERRLKSEGYANITMAENGQQALQALAEKPHDLILLDIMMPEMDGYQMLEHLKSDMALRDIPVIMISAVGEIDSVVRCIELGAEDYMPKPFNAVLLKARVNSCLEKSRLRHQESSYIERLESESKRADRLLHAIFPSGVVQELKTTNNVQPRRFENVAVLFCDIVGFTDYCDRHPPETVVAHLQGIVEAFEGIVRSHGLEKIKTIGDAFMATAGLIHHVEEPILASVRCGLEMAAVAPTLEPGWKVRVGIHIGPVVAGVIGCEQYIYDLWGDTVNTAARIVIEADPGAVLVSASTWMHLHGRCQGRSNGFVELKGKGKIELIECQQIK